MHTPMYTAVPKKRVLPLINNKALDLIDKIKIIIRYPKKYILSRRVARVMLKTLSSS